MTVSREMPGSNAGGVSLNLMKLNLSAAAGLPGAVAVELAAGLLWAAREMNLMKYGDS